MQQIITLSYGATLIKRICVQLGELNTQLGFEGQGVLYSGNLVIGKSKWGLKLMDPKFSFLRPKPCRPKKSPVTQNLTPNVPQFNITITILDNPFVGVSLSKVTSNILTPLEVLSFQIPTLFILLHLLIRVTIMLYIHYIKPWASQTFVEFHTTRSFFNSYS